MSYLEEVKEAFLFLHTRSSMNISEVLRKRAVIFFFPHLICPCQDVPLRECVSHPLSNVAQWHTSGQALAFCPLGHGRSCKNHETIEHVFHFLLGRKGGRVYSAMNIEKVIDARNYQVPSNGAS